MIEDTHPAGTDNMYKSYPRGHFPSISNICPGGAIYTRFVQMNNMKVTNKFGKGAGGFEWGHMHRNYIKILLLSTI